MMERLQIKLSTLVDVAAVNIFIYYGSVFQTISSFDCVVFSKLEMVCVWNRFKKLWMILKKFENAFQTLN